MEARIWDISPAQGLEFPHLVPDKDYWITSDDSKMARFVISKGVITELVADDVCTTAKIIKEENKAQVTMLPNCHVNKNKSLTLCLREVKGIPHATYVAYTDYQTEAKTIVK